MNNESCNCEDGIICEYCEQMILETETFNAAQLDCNA